MSFRKKQHNDINRMLIVVLSLLCILSSFNRLSAQELKKKEFGETTNIPLNERSVASGTFLLNLNAIASYLQMFGLVSDSDGFKVGLNSKPDLGYYYFVLDGFAVGSSIYYQTQKTKTQATVNDGHSWGLNPGLFYYFCFGDNFHLFTGMGVVYEMVVKDEEEVRNSLGFDVALGLNYMLIDNLGIFTEFSYEFLQSDLRNQSSIIHSTLLSFGLKVFL